MPKQLKVLFVPVPGAGHINACVSIAELLIERGHRVVFAVPPYWSGKLTKYGIEELLLEGGPPPGGAPGGAPMNDMTAVAKHFVQTGKIGPLSPLDKISSDGSGMPGRVAKSIKFDQQIKPILKSLKPDLVMLDQFMLIPSVLLSGIPYVNVWSAGPLMIIDDPRTPPMASGLSVLGDKKLWQEFRDITQKACDESWHRFNDYVISKDCQPLNYGEYKNNTKCLNIYGFPAELDYTDVRPLPKNYIRFDNLKRTDNHLMFELPEKLMDKPGKLVYFSLGSMGAADVVNMKRLVGILSKSKHRFIVSKGPLHDEFDLPNNMWGEGYVPQIQVLPLVDLVVTHGGNNTITETFYFGKPMIVLPLFGDQYDNAQQIHDKGFGIRLDAYLCSEDELLNSIESLLNNKDLIQKLVKIAKRIQTDNSIAKLPEIIDDYVINREKYIN